MLGVCDWSEGFQFDSVSVAAGWRAATTEEPRGCHVFHPPLPASPGEAANLGEGRTHSSLKGPNTEQKGPELSCWWLLCLQTKRLNSSQA